MIIICTILNFSHISKIRVPMFWLSKLPKLVKEPAPIVFSRLTPLKPTRRMEVTGLNRLTRSISQVSNMSRPTRSLRRSLSIVSSYSRSARNSRSRSGSQQRTLQVPLNQCITLPIPERSQRRLILVCYMKWSDTCYN